MDTFAHYEVEPLERPGIGRYATRLGITPAVGVLLEKRVSQLDVEGRSRLVQIICDAVACGYRTIANLEGATPTVEFDPRRDPPLDTLWAF